MDKQSVIANLKAARELISVPERWTKGAYARGRRNRPVRVLGPAATCYCVIGAVRRVTRVETGAATSELSALASVLPAGCRYLFLYNDDPGTSHADVLGLFDRAIANLEAASEQSR